MACLGWWVRCRDDRGGKHGGDMWPCGGPMEVIVTIVSKLVYNLLKGRNQVI